MDSDLVRKPTVRRGDTVTIVAESSLLRITDLGKAKQDGAVGDYITVLNLRSKKVITAQITGPEQVAVNPLR
jgi:flagella basal body P-ring formation protein FlgA